jgi:hypothetical protein
MYWRCRQVRYAGEVRERPVTPERGLSLDEVERFLDEREATS